MNPLIIDIWRCARILKATYGFTLGLMQVTYHVFLYEHFGANPAALKITVGLYILTSLGVMCLEIPTGALGDYIGRKKTVIACFVVAALVYFLRSWIYFIPDHALSLLVASIAALLYALSYSLYSGSLTAWVVDSVHERQIPEGSGPILAQMYSAMMFTKILGAIIGIWCYLSGIVFLAFGLSSIAALLCAVYCGITMQETRSLAFFQGNWRIRETVHRMGQIVRIGYHISCQQPPVRYMILMFVGFMLVVHIVNALWPIAVQANFDAARMTPYWYLIVFSGMIAAYGGTRLLSWILAGELEHHAGEGFSARLWGWFVGLCLLMGGSILLLGVGKLAGQLTPLLFLLMFMCFNVGYGFLMPAYETLLNSVIPSTHAAERATINSFAPLLVDACVVVLALPSSGSSGATTLVGWMLPATLLICLTVIIHVVMRRYFHHQQKSLRLDTKLTPVAAEVTH